MKNKILLLLFILCFTLPRTFQIEKFILLFILFYYFVFVKCVKKSFYVSAFQYSILFIIPLLIGIINDNNYVYILNSIRINLFFPIILFLILQQFNLNDIIILLKKSAYISLILITIITFSTILYGLQISPINLNTIFYPEETAMRLEGGYIHIINSSITYLMFLTPLYFYDNFTISIKKRNFYFFIIILILAIISGRRILLLPFIILFIINFKKIIIPFLLMTIIIFNITESDFFDRKIIYDRFIEALNSEGSSTVRKEQADAFYVRIKSNPILGEGLGSYMKEYTRSEEETAYEKTFHYMVFSFGLPIFLLIIFFYFYLFYKIYFNKLIKNHSFKISFFISFITLLISSNTNPYWLSSFDYTLPLALMLRFSQNDNVS